MAEKVEKDQGRSYVTYKGEEIPAKDETSYSILPLHLSLLREG